MDVLGLVDIPQWILILIGVLTAGYIYYARKHSVWSSQGVTQVWPCIPFLGNVVENFRSPMHEVEMNRYKKYGKIYGMYEGVLPVLMVSEPELIRQVLVKDFPKFSARRKLPFKEPFFEDALTVIHGERWKWMRAVVSQTFSSGKMRKMSPLVSECTKSLLENLHEASEKKEPVDCKRVMGAFTMDVIARCAFGTKIDTHKDPNNPFVAHAKQVVPGVHKLTFFIEEGGLWLVAPQFMHHLLHLSVRNNRIIYRAYNLVESCLLNRKTMPVESSRQCRRLMGIFIPRRDLRLYGNI